MEHKLTFEFNAEKSKKLKAERGVSFEEIIVLLDGGQGLGIMRHPNKAKYPRQEIYVVDVNGYAYLVPFVRDGQVIFLKTIIPSRKATKRYLAEREG